jgi:uncharacterized protein (DUF2141 family)
MMRIGRIIVNLVYLMFLLPLPAAFAQDAKVRISGECANLCEGTLYVLLVDQASFSTPMRSVAAARISIGPAKAAEGSQEFSFECPPGKYGLRCFIDKNGSGKLDSGPFGPVEPWGFSWKGKPRLAAPRFEDIAFDASSGAAGLRIELR